MARINGGGANHALPHCNAQPRCPQTGNGFGAICRFLSEAAGIVWPDNCVRGRALTGKTVAHCGPAGGRSAGAASGCRRQRSGLGPGLDPAAARWPGSSSAIGTCCSGPGLASRGLEIASTSAPPAANSWWRMPLDRLKALLFAAAQSPRQKKQSASPCDATPAQPPSQRAMPWRPMLATGHCLARIALPHRRRQPPRTSSGKGLLSRQMCRRQGRFGADRSGQNKSPIGGGRYQGGACADLLWGMSPSGVKGPADRDPGANPDD